MKKFAWLAGMFLAGFSAYAAELPEIVARCGDRTVGREEAARLMHDASHDPKGLSRRDLMKQLLTDLFCAEAMTKMLTDAGFPPTAEQAERAMSDFFRRSPAGMKRPDPGDLHRMAQEEKNRLLWAYLRYLAARRPEFFRIPPQAVERYYREYQTDFLLPRRVTASRYLAAEAAPLTTLRARIRQGEPPERVLSSLPGVREVPVTETDPAVARMRAGDWSAVEPVPGGYAVTYATGEKPAGYVPLEQAAPLIRETLILRRTETELRRSLESILAEKKMEFYF